MGILGRFHNRLEEGLEGVWVLFREFFPCRKGAARVSRPYLLTQHENKPGLFIDGPLIEWIRSEVTIDVARFQIRHHLRRRNDTDLHVLVRVDAALSQIVA